MCTSLAKLWKSSTLTKADTKPQTPTTQVITEGSWSATMGIPRESATIWSSFQAALHPRVVQGWWCSLRVFGVTQMNSHSTCQNGLKQATISGTSKHCRSVFDGRWELRNTISFRSTPLHQTFYFPSQVLIHAPVRQVLRGCWAASQFLTKGWSSKRGTESRIPNHPRKMGCHIELNLWNQQHKLQ